ncbi:MAG: patatin-like phospholipase family protein, partial [Lentimicrobiaceae bacterium]|nr:patatin-like phospholipase family protein [Lentimicrobiaceae bacterium]
MKSHLPLAPFENLALSLSGGGYRAAAFHLGLLTYLSSVKWKDKSLLERVRILSTVSGGTFTGVCYA